MLATLIRRLLPRAPSVRDAVQQPVVGFNPDPDFTSSLDDVPRYPPFDHGLPNVSVEDVLKSQKNLVAKLADAELPFVTLTVRNLASYVHLLPATTNDFFCGAGGLLRLCLETGFHSYVASQGNIFTAKDPAERRRELEPKWQLAAFLAGLCCELGRAISTSVVTNDHGQQWLPFEPLTEWLAKTNSHRYFLRPPQTTSHIGDSTNLSLIIFKAIVPNEALQHITTDDRSILMAMFETVSRLNESYGAGQFSRTVRKVRDQVILRDKNTNPLTFGKPKVGVHVEPYLINGMRALVKNGTWKINTKLARVHVAADGGYVFWVTGVAEILAFLKDQGAQGMQTDPRSLGELLMQEGVFLPNRDGGLWWYIKTPGSATVYEVIKLANPGIILDDDTLATIDLYPEPIAVDPATAKDALDAHAASATPGAAADSTPRTSAAESALSSRQLTNALAIAADDTAADKEAAPPATTPSPAAPRAPAKARKAGAAAVPAARPPSAPPSVSAVGSPTPASPVPSAQGAPTAAVGAAQAVDPLTATFSSTPSVLVQMRKLRDLHNAGAENGTFWIEFGLAIPLSIVQGTGDHLAVILALQQADALFIATGEVKKFHKVPRGNDFVTSIVIKSDKALAFGFTGAQ